MNLKNPIVRIALIIVVCTSCKNSLNIQAPYKNVTIVYGLMDQNDPVHYFRINKGFEGTGNAYTMAMQYDSIYYPVSTIHAIIEDSNPVTESIVKIDSLDTTTTIPLDSGTFAYPKQLLYYTNATLNPNDYYNLVLTNTKTGQKLRGSTSLLQDIQLASPSSLDSRVLTLLNTPYFTEIAWSSSPNGRIYQMSLLFYYDNQFGAGPRVLQTPLTLLFAEQTSPTISGNFPMSYYVTAQQLYALIISSIQPITGVTRYADSLAVTFTTGTDDLNTYIQLSQPPSGINQDVPSFSDITNGVGIYTARHVQTFYKLISTAITDSLTQEPRFTALGFVP